MINNAFHAWVIHKYWSGDTSARVIFFTQEHGLVNCLFKGGRTPKKQALLQAFVPLWLAMDVRGEAHFVKTLEIAEVPLRFLGKTLFAGLYLNELLKLALKPNDAHNRLYSAYTQSLYALMDASDRLAVEAILRRFEWVLLTACGYHMSLTHDADSAQPIVVDGYYQFIAGKGFVGDKNGICGAHILAMAEDKLDNAAVLNVAKYMMRCAIDHALGGKIIRARELYRS